MQTCHTDLRSLITIAAPAQPSLARNRLGLRSAGCTACAKPWSAWVRLRSPAGAQARDRGGRRLPWDY